jgi:hypothetical protein
MSNTTTEKTESIIGKKVFLLDNSYAKNLTTGKHSYLAGTLYDSPEEVTIITEPFLATVDTWGYNTKQIDCMIVRCKRNETHFVLARYSSVPVQHPDYV